MTKIVFLDFDKTITDIHTGGFPHPNKIYWRNSTNKEMITKLLLQLKEHEYKLYLITRANETETLEYVNLHLTDIFEGIKGNSHELVDKIDNNSLSWAKWKISVIQNILLELNHTDMSTVFFFDDTEINVEMALSVIPNSFKVDYESQHLFELLSKHVLPQSELVYNVPIYVEDKLQPVLSDDGMLQYILRKTSQRTINKVIYTNNDYCIINVFTAVYSTHFKEVFGVIIKNGVKMFARFSGDDFALDIKSIQNRIRNLDEFINHIHYTYVEFTPCGECKLNLKSRIQIANFI